MLSHDFLLDQNLERRFATYLRGLGHSVSIVGVDEPAGLPDPEVLAIAYRTGRILITKDLGFGRMVVHQGLPHSGIILMRVRADDFETKRRRLAAVLANYAGELDRFIVVTERQIRVRSTKVS